MKGTSSSTLSGHEQGVSSPSIGARLLASLSGRIPAVPVSFSYKVGLFIVAVMMLLLPVIYLVLIAGLIAGFFFYAATGSKLLDDPNIKGPAGMALFLGPLMGLLLMIIFMIKPLFAKRPRRFFPLTVSRQEQPLLYAYVDALCDVVGAPRPMRIDVNTDINASAGMEAGVTGLISRKLVLTIGLPLVAGLDLKDLSGVLAHELGHFGQGAAMRLSFVIRKINLWLARMVYERDAWDLQLQRAWRSKAGGIAWLMIGIALLFIWCGRRVLWLLMVAGAAVSAFMLRQMEFNADRYEVAVAGTESFCRATEKLPLLLVAMGAVMNELERMWHENRLADDLPAMVCLRETQMPEAIRKKVVEQNREQKKSKWYDSHPSASQRVGAAKKVNSPGMIKVSGPATLLFKDFKDLSKRATVAFYTARLGGAVRPKNLVAVESVEEQRKERDEKFDAARRFFQGLVHPFRPVFLPRSFAAPRDANQAAEIVLDSRTKLIESTPAAISLARQFIEADTQLMQVLAVRALRDAGEKADPKQFAYATATDVELAAVTKGAQQRKEQAWAAVNKVIAHGINRLAMALWLEEHRRVSSAPISEEEQDNADGGEYQLSQRRSGGGDDRLRDAFAALSRCAGSVESLRYRHIALSALVSRLRQENNPRPLIEAIIAAGKSEKSALDDIRTKLHTAPYPYEHPEKKATMQQVLAPFAANPQQTHMAAKQCLDLIYPLYVRILGDLCRRAEAVESEVLGLEPLPEPDSDSK